MFDFGTRSESELDPLPVVLFAFCCDGARLLFVRCDVLYSWSNDVLAQTIIISRACLRPPQSVTVDQKGDFLEEVKGTKTV